MTQRVRVQNAAFTSTRTTAGALGEGDRGAFQAQPTYTGNPYESNDYVFRWRQYTHLYQTSWEARKIIRIIPEDALRKGWIAESIDNEKAEKIKTELDRLQFLTILKRSLILERLLGGCLSFMGLDAIKDDPNIPYHPKEGSHLRFLNAIPISRISRIRWCNDPLSEAYMRPEVFLINATPVHVSRCLVWDGEPLFDPYDFALTNFRSNLAGFGPSKLAPIWDDVVMAVGTRHAAYQLIHTNNSIIAAVSGLQDLGGTKSGKEALQKVKEIANQLSIWRAAVVSGDQVDIRQTPASFGSVPELILTYIQILSAASDIPATRFIGQAPGGLNATGESDLENYYNATDSYQQQRLVPNLRRAYDVIGYRLFPNDWAEARKKLEFKFPPLWNQSDLEEAQTAAAQLDNLLKLLDQRLISEEKVIAEINARGCFSVTLDDTDIDTIDRTGFGDDDESVMYQTGNEEEANTAKKAIASLRNSVYIKNADNASLLITQAGGNPEAFDLDQFRKGFIVEQEHADVTKGDRVAVAKIVLAHLTEKADYYTLLEKVENSLEFPIGAQPSEKQAKAGNYKKHHTRVHGLDFSIENPKGSERRGRDAQGNEWKSTLPAHYGYIKRTTGADGDHVDAYIGPVEESELVFVVDQQDKDTGLFDEHKCIFGCLSLLQAKELYLDGFSDGKGKERIKAITPVHVNDFKDWINTGDTTVPFANKGEFREEDHPRQDDGKFGSKGTSSKGKEKPEQETKTKKKTPARRRTTPEERAAKEKEQWEKSMEGKSPEQRKAFEAAKERGYKVPPAWTDVWVNPDPNGDLQVRGKDVKGRSQSIYSTAHHEKAAMEKFNRLKAFSAARSSFFPKIEEALGESEEAKVLYLIDRTGFRIGSERDTGAKVQAFGASTLTSDHVKVEGDTTTFNFVGKKGVAQTHVVQDPAIAKMVEGKKGKLFDTSAGRIRAYLKEVSGGDFKVKDFRTYVATAEALTVIKGMEPPKTEKEKAQKILEVAKVVSNKLGNTPTMARDSYIDPMVFNQWRIESD